MLDLDSVNFDKANGLITVTTIDDASGVVLMVAHADREALEKTQTTGEMYYRSRTRGLWHKGATSGNTQAVVSLTMDCDNDAVLARVVPAGPACHTGTRSCFGDNVAAGALDVLDKVIAERLITTDEGGAAPSYTRRLGTDRNLRLKKIGEEAAELVAACADGDSEQAIEEAADLIYHVIVAVRANGGSLDDIEKVLAARRA